MVGLAAFLLLGASAYGQSLVELSQIPAIQKAFDEAASVAPALRLRCSVSPVRPALNFSFRLQTGYVADIPLNQLAGPGHALTTSLRVTPEGRPPVYFTKTEILPPVPETKADAETSGAWITGEGNYNVELLIEDDTQRPCRGAWKIQAHRNGSEARLLAVTPAGAVEEIAQSNPVAEPVKPGPRIARLTILLHAAPLVPSMAQLPPGDVQTLIDSLGSLLRELPAQTVRLVAFNLDQRIEVLRRDEFVAADMPVLREALGSLQLALVDYKSMRDRPEAPQLLAGLVRAEVASPHPPDALVIMGPRTRLQEDIPADVPPGVQTPPVFGLEFVRTLGRPSVMFPGNGRGRGMAGGPGMRRPDSGNPGPNDASLPGPVEDSIGRMIRRLKGQTTIIRTPHDLADAIQRIDVRISRTAPAADPIAPVVRTPKAEPAAETPKAAEPAEAAVPTNDEDPVQVLMQVRDRALEHGQNIPNHTCVESMQRDRYEPIAGRSSKACAVLLARREEGDAQARLRLNSTDWVRLDVAFDRHREIYSWAGASRFEEGELDELIPEGASGTGPFATLLLSIFSPRYPRYSFEGENQVEGRRLFEYGFRVPQDESSYRVRARKDWVVTGYSGKLFVDPKTTELVRLVVHTEELPPVTGICQTATMLEFGAVRLESAEYLLPKVARQRFIGREGDEGENQMNFSACREYQAESKVDFDTPAESRRTADGTAGWELPAGLPVSIKMTTVVRIGQAAAGDRVEGRLQQAVQDEAQKILVPAGALVEGRLMRVEVDYGPRTENSVVLRWEAVQVGGVMRPLALTPYRPPIGLRNEGSLRRRGVDFELPQPGESRYAVYHPPGSVLEGAVSEWFTAKP